MAFTCLMLQKLEISTESMDCYACIGFSMYMANSTQLILLV